ncbi:MAG: 1,4-alpha-glucan branching protein GlgB [Clostridia bacterium]|nr:1,4-alpha-glucan branching protein GlgB [Clostridia bacterium]
MAHLTDLELYYFNEGTTNCAYETFGCHPVELDGRPCYRFALWAPNAVRIGVAGDFNGWSDTALPMERIGDTGVWEAFSFDAKEGDLYKFALLGCDGQLIYKADPYAFATEHGGTASRIYTKSDFSWTDKTYLKKHRKPYNKPMNIYEVHLGSWRANQSYRELAHSLIDYVVDMGYTHIEVMPLMAYPFNPSWGYQVTGYYAATSRYGSPDDLKYFVNRAHSKGIGVIMDWVPAHFTRDGYGLARFDGSALYEHADPRRSDMKQWGTLLFDYEKPQVQSFLISNAVYWLKEFHMDGLRVDAVSCMLYLDYGRQAGEWLPNHLGGKENLAAIEMFKKLARAVSALEGNKLVIAEESTAFPRVTSKHGEDSLGFDFKWNMGWMNDMLAFMQMDSLFRKWHHDKLTFSLMYAFSERYILPFSHDEVVHGKLSMLNKMPGDYWQKFAQLRMLYLYQIAHPGKKLTFMGMEFGQFIEWRFDESLDWLLLDYPKHLEMQRFVRDLNHLYTDTPAFYEDDDDWNGFQWITVDDSIHSIASFVRKDRKNGVYLCAFNFTPVPWDDYFMGSQNEGTYEEVFSTDPYRYGGTGQYENGKITTINEPWEQFPYRIRVKLAPFGAAIFKFTEKGRTK